MCGLPALAGCATPVGHRGEFHLTADQVNGAWVPVMVRAERQAEAYGIDPLLLMPPSFSSATCRWIKPQVKALCRYRVARGPVRPGRERWQVDEEAELDWTETGWDFGY